MNSSEIVARLEPFKKGIVAALVAGFVLIGVMLRWQGIFQSDFVFYDEGYYLNDNWREYVDFVGKYFPHYFTFQETLRSLYGNLQVSLGSGKALWIFLINLRVYFAGSDAWYFARVLSAIAGCLTLGVIYLFARRYFQSQTVGLLSVILLAVFPGHVFYSRLGMQEALSTLCFLSGFYFYVFPRKLHVRTFIAGVFFVLAYFTNYRLIVLPVIVAACEIFLSWSLRERVDVRKYFYCMLTFLTLLLGIASLDQGQHMKVILPWMMHQADLARKEPFHWYNVLSYPYFTFRLESFWFGLLLWGNFYNVNKGRRQRLLPFVLVCVQMAIFSFSEEKGARYVCVAYPFMVMSVAALLVQLLEEVKPVRWRWGIVAVAALMVGGLLTKSLALAEFQSAYRPAMAYLSRRDPNAGIVASQKWILNLYTPHPKRVQDLPHTLPQLFKRRQEGFRYLVLDPQAYISWGEGGRRFEPQLEDYLGFVVHRVKPLKVFPHFNQAVLERFVFEHNTNLARSIRFLEFAGRNDVGAIRIYDMPSVVTGVTTALQKANVAIPE